MKKLKMITLCGALVVPLLQTGCITTVSRKYAPVQYNRSSKKEAKSIAYNFRRTSRCSTNAEFDKDDYSDKLTGAWAAPQDEGTAIRQFRDVFSRRAQAINPSLNETGGDCDIYMDMMQQNSWNGLGLFAAALSGFTWATIPCWGDDGYTLYVEVSNKAGLKKTYQLTSVVTTITWFPFILGTPFTGLPATRVNEITWENWIELFNRMEADGFFDKSTPAKTTP